MKKIADKFTQNKTIKMKNNKIMKYAVVGIASTCIHYFGMFQLMEKLNVETFWASLFGYLFGALFNYFSNYKFTFGAKSKHSKALPKFMLTNLLGLIVNQTILVMCLGLNMGIILSQLIETAISVFVGFYINSNWTFKGRMEVTK